MVCCASGVLPRQVQNSHEHLYCSQFRGVNFLTLRSLGETSSIFKKGHDFKRRPAIVAASAVCNATVLRDVSYPGICYDPVWSSFRAHRNLLLCWFFTTLKRVIFTLNVAFGRNASIGVKYIASENILSVSGISLELEGKLHAKFPQNRLGKAKRFALYNSMYIIIFYLVTFFEKSLDICRYQERNELKPNKFL